MNTSSLVNVTVGRLSDGALGELSLGSLSDIVPNIDYFFYSHDFLETLLE